MSEPLRGVVEGLRAIVSKKHWSDVRDADLLRHFVETRSSDAFACLMRRHGPMVMGLARRIVRDQQVAEDVFQATFLILARKAKSIRGRDALPAWLHSVALRLATRAKKSRQRIEEKHTHAAKSDHVDPLDEITAREYLTILDQEIARLPEKYRLPLILCQLEGLSQEEAAKRLDTTSSSIKGMLERGRTLLRQRLIKRGLPAGSLVLGPLAFGTTAKAAVGPTLIHATLQAALTSQGASASAVALAEGAIMMMTIAKLKIICCAAVLCGAVAVGAGWMAVGAGTGEVATPHVEPMAAMKLQATVQPKKEPQKLVDLYGDPLPKGALARLGTERFRHGRDITAVAFADGGKVLISAGRLTYGLCIWDAATGLPLHRLNSPDYVTSLAVSTDGKLLVTDGLRLIDVATGTTLRRLDRPGPGGGSALIRVAFSPDGQVVATAGFGKATSTIYLLDVNTGKELRRMEGNIRQVTSLAFSQDGKRLASAGGAVQIWDTANGKEHRRIDAKYVSCVTFAPNGTELATAGAGLRLWDSETGKEQHVLQAENEGTLLTTAAFSLDGKLLASGGTSGAINLWDPTSGKELRNWQTGHAILSATFSPDGKVLASVGVAESAIRRWDTATGKEIDFTVSHTSEVQLLSFAADTKTLISCGRDGKILEWDTATGQARDERQSLALGKLSGLAQTGWMWKAADLSPDGKLLALSAGDLWLPPALKLWDAMSGKELRELKGHAKAVLSVRFSQDGKTLASGGDDGVRLWDSATGKELQHFQGIRLTEMQIAFSQMLTFSPNGKLLAGASRDKIICIWDVATGKEVRRCENLDAVPIILAFSPDGGALAYADSIKVCLLSMTTGKEIMRFGGQENIWSLAFSPSGRVLAVGGVAKGHLDDGSEIPGTPMIRLWEVPSGDEIRKISVPHGIVQSGVISLAFSADGHTLASGGADSTILLWDMTDHTEGRKIVPPNLTPKMLDAIWLNLASDAAKADRAIWSLALSPQQSMPFLKEHMRPLPAVDANEVAKLVGEFGSKTYAERQKAAQALEKLGEPAEAAVRKHLEGELSLEVRQSLQQFLTNQEKATRRNLRAIEALELIGTTEAREVLGALAKGVSSPRVSEAAGAALARLARRS